MSAFKRNDNFSGFVSVDRAFPAELEELPELQEQGFAEGLYKGYIRPLIPTGFRFGPVNVRNPLLKPPQLSDKYQELIAKSNRLASTLREIRDVEGDVKVNGKLIPGIFQGLSLAGGNFIEKFDNKRTEFRIAGKKLASVKTFQVDKGVKPIAGSLRFVLMDDTFSYAQEKVDEFIRIVTHYEDGLFFQKTGIPRVFDFECFLNKSNGAFQFRTIKVKDYRINMPIGTEGRIDASFDFEQFDLLSSEKPKAPKTKPSGTDEQPTEMSEPASLPPAFVDPETGNLEFETLVIAS